MSVPTPHFFLFSETSGKNEPGEWSFVLQAADGSATVEAADFEPNVRGERLELLAVVRGLEALEQPSRVTLVTPSRYVNRGLTRGLDEWGRNDWTWECFGEMVPVKNGDLWRRVDRARRIHRIDGTYYRLDAPHGGFPSLQCRPKQRVDRPGRPRGIDSPRTPTKRRRRKLAWAKLRRRMVERVEGWRLTFAQFGTCLLPKPWLE